MKGGYRYCVSAVPGVPALGASSCSPFRIQCSLFLTETSVVVLQKSSSICVCLFICLWIDYVAFCDSVRSRKNTVMLHFAEGLQSHLES